MFNFVFNRIKGLNEIQDEQPIQTGIYLIFVISCDIAVEVPVRTNFLIPSHCLLQYIICIAECKILR